MSIEKDIRFWMAANVERCTDGYGDVNTTQLAENCAHAIGKDSWLDDELHIVWDISTEFYPEDRLP